MRGVWATLISVWALFAIVAVLAWTRQPASAPAPASTTVVVKGKNGASQLVVVPASTAPQATTRTSPVPVG
jgi:cyanate permease